MSSLANLVSDARGGGYGPRADLLEELDARLGERPGHPRRRELEAFLSSAAARDWLTIDEAMRAYRYGRRGMSAKIEATGDQTSLGFASMAADGRLREAAVRRLDAGDPLAARFLALRTVDWVQPVAELARSALSARIPVDPEIASALAPLVFALAGRERGSAIAEQIVRTASTDARLRAALLRSADRATRRSTVGDQSVRDACDVEELIALATRDPDNVVARIAGVAALERLDIAEIGGGLERLFAAPAAVRAAVLDALPDATASAALVRRGLFDRSPLVRAAAQSHLRRSAADPAASYRHSLAAGAHLPVAIEELAALGTSAEREAMLGFLGASDAAVRRAAVRGASPWLPPKRLVEVLVPLLQDASPGVARLAARRLRPHAALVDRSLLHRLAGSQTAHTRRAAYRLLRDRSTVDRLEADLVAIQDPDALNRGTALRDLEGWVRTRAARAERPGLELRRRLDRRLSPVEGLLAPRMVAGLRFHLGLRPGDLEA